MKKKKKKLHKVLQHQQTNKINHVNSDHLWRFIEKTLSSFYVNGITVWLVCNLYLHCYYAEVLEILTSDIM